MSVAVRAIRGAIQIDHDSRDEILAGTTELVREVLRRNDVAGADRTAAEPVPDSANLS